MNFVVIQVKFKSKANVCNAHDESCLLFADVVIARNNNS